MSAVMDSHTMLPGFSDPGRDSQKLFRILMDAIARPGVIADVPHGPDAPGKLSSAAAAIALSLFDFETRVWLDDAVGTDTLAGWLRFHCGCPLTTNPAEAHFAIVADIASAPPLSAFMQGEPRYPDQSTTIIFDLPALSGGIAVELDGPGIRTPITIAPVGPTAEFWASAQDNHEQFQCGVDMIFTSGARLLGLPRSSNITLKEG